MAELPTVQIVNPSNPDDYIIINEDDFDEDAHTLWEERDEGGSEEDQGQEQSEAPDASEEDRSGEEQGSEDEAEEEDEAGVEADPLAELSVAELREALEDVEDVGRLEALLADEERTTATDAIEERIEELSEGGEEA